MASSSAPGASAGGAAPPAIFTHTARLRAAVALISGVAVKRMPLLLNRIVVHLRDRTATVFNADELAQLCDVFALTLEQLHTVLDSLSYVYEQAAYHLLTAEKLKAQLIDVLAVAEPQAAAMAFVWGEQREAYLANLRERSFGTPLTLESVHFRSAVTLGTESQSRRKDIHTVLSFELKDENGPDDAAPKTVCVEMSPERLQALYDTLEKIQGQLDALTDKPQ